MNPKIIAMYLPQFHEIPENNEWWGKGFTDWVSVKQAKALYPGHEQPREPLNDNYYDLSEKETIKWQSDLAQNYGVDGWAIYHYWFKDGKKLLEKPAEIILTNKDITIPFCFAWDNASWVRTWSKFQGNPWSPKIDGDNSDDSSNNGMLLEMKYGHKEDWKKHFDYLYPFFSDSRYIKIDGKPIFIFFTNIDKQNLLKMGYYWNEWAKKQGLPGIFIITRRTPFNKNMLFNGTIKYEPTYSGWQAIQIVKQLLKIRNGKSVNGKPDRISYDRIWRKILRSAKRDRNKTSFLGAFVDFDDTPRKGGRGKVVEGATPDKFLSYFSQLYDLCKSRKKELIFITAWNEWGECAVLEPDKKYKHSYLEAVKKIKSGYQSTFKNTGP